MTTMNDEELKQDLERGESVGADTAAGTAAEQPDSGEEAVGNPDDAETTVGNSDGAETTVGNSDDAETTVEKSADKVSDELEAVKDRLVRTMAEYDNFRKRSAREKDALRAEIITNVTSKFLPVMDNLERALNAECSDGNYKNGVKMIFDSFMETLKGLGVEEIESDGAAFNPNYHQAVQRVENSDAESGTVVQTFAKGYKIGEKVIRFAMVSVAN